jgi:two-component sensor histidine kinase
VKCLSLLFFSCCALILFLPAAAFGQEPNSFNINIDNGLPSNHTYRIIVDHHGYLWIGTDKGVVRYNGYDFKVFSLSDGLPNEDVWELYEDKKGRIWMGSHSNDIGYLANNKFHKVFVKNFQGILYPMYFRSYENGIFFPSSEYSNSEQHTVLVERNDTLYKYKIEDSLYNNTREKTPRLAVYTTSDGRTTVFYNKAFHNLVYPITQIAFGKEKWATSFLYSIDDEQSLILQADFRLPIVGDYLVCFNKFSKSNKIIALNLFENKTISLSTKDFGVRDSVEYVYPDIDDQYFFAITTSSLIKFDREITYVSTTPIKNIIGKSDVNGKNIKTVLQHNFWNNCVGTTSNGLWLNYFATNHFKKENLDLQNFRYLGGLADSLGFWWNDYSKLLATIDKNDKIKYFRFINISDVRKIIYFNADSFIIAANYSYYFSNATGQLTKISSYNFRSKIYDLFIENKDNIYACAGIGFYRLTKDGQGTEHIINNERFRDVTYDPARRKFWVLNNDKIFIYSGTKDTIYANKASSPFGVRKVEKIVIDSFGNVFFKGYDNITLYDPENNSCTEIFPNYNMTEAKILVVGSHLIVAGPFGIIYSKILSKNKISDPVAYLNIKNINYKHVFDCIVKGKKVWINTEKGLFSVNMPDDSAYSHKFSDISGEYKFIVNYMDTVKNIKDGDTILISQKDLKLQFDVINPKGNGTAKYLCQFPGDTAWRELNANELNLPATLSPDTYYPLSIRAFDNVWKSDKLLMHIFIQPYWWQTNSGRRIMWTTVVLSVLLLFGTSVVITRQLVINASKKRNLRMELELKAIYAQINPHFIFNTLNSALLLVSKNKMEEAYTHISKFSRLLRSYIKSSRNKLITIEEETANLRDYLELQQTRFKNKFEYEITVDSRIEPQRIKIPSLLLQPFVENAINHGLLQKDETGRLAIKFKIAEEKNEIICTIEDNGIGRKMSKSINENNPGKTDSYGDLLIRDLVSIFNKYENMNIEIEYKDKEEPLTGTIVLIYIKNPNYE